MRMTEGMKLNGRRTIKLEALGPLYFHCAERGFIYNGVLIYLPFRRIVVFIAANKQLDRPNYQGEKDVHPSPPDL